MLVLKGLNCVKNGVEVYRNIVYKVIPFKGSKMAGCLVEWVRSDKVAVKSLKRKTK